MKRLSALLSIALLLLASQARAEDVAASAASHGIPPEIARKLSIAPETLRQIEDAVFNANRALIDLDANHKKAQLELDRELHSRTPDETKALALASTASETELAVRKNRLSLLLKIRQILGPELWDRVQAEIRGGQPAAAVAPPANSLVHALVFENLSSLPPLRCGRNGSKPVEVRVDTLGKNHLAIALNYPSLHQQFRYLIEEVRTLNGRKALAGHRLANADGKDAWLDQSGSFLLFSGTPPRSDDLNATYQFVDARPEVQIDLESGAEGLSGHRAASVYLRCENLDAFLNALSTP